ncbi:MAG TPA: LCP family protein [Acidimicrobiia bacterium]|nr:LCP family protein [Acidimicrobiia bacterium]
MPTRRDTARPSRRLPRHPQRWYVGLALLAGLVAAAFGDPIDADATARDGELTTTTVAPSPAPAQTFLLTHVDADRRADLYILVGLQEGGDDGTAVLVPAATLVEVPAFGLQTLADLPRLAGIEAVETTVENALALGIDRVIALDDDLLARAMAPLGALTVEFRRPVQVEDDAGTVSFAAGEQEITAADAVRLLSAPDPDGELAHLVTVRAVFDGWRAALRDREVAAAVFEIADLGPVRRAGRADLRYETLPVESVTTAGDERLALRRADVAELVDRSFGWARLGDGDRAKVEILNGTGGVGVTQVVARIVVPAGVEVTLTNNVPGFGVEETVVVYYRDRDADEARRLVEVLGVGRVAKGDSAIQVVDLSIIVGADFPLPTS